MIAYSRGMGVRVGGGKERDSFRREGGKGFPRTKEGGEVPRIVKAKQGC